ncbi:hypothetical protein CSOJ01_10806 [Colletotrichum sojae]|uniref:Uncharacterized protein n=1 Tax=Colletotrichum sojae TaxID=2175907 RepID=A0A8H6IZW7_9PEZI|nr:hypothetical protein CSOJ01_10806 [Colletotrichum sojae]
MTLILPRGPKMIEAICPGCFKSFTKIGSMHRVSTHNRAIPRLTTTPNEQHIYEDRCRKPVPRFVKKIKAQHDARVAAAAARSAARAAARAAPPPRDQNTTHHQAPKQTQLCPVPILCGCGLAFPRETDLEVHKNGGYCQLKQQQTQVQDLTLGDLIIDASWITFPNPWMGWLQFS